MAQWLREPAALAEYLGLLPSTHMVTQTHQLLGFLMTSFPLLAPTGTCTHVVH